MNPYLVPRYGTAAYSKVLNEQKQCNAYGCAANRAGLDGWCRKHRSAARRYGHPFARVIAPKEYRGSVEEARRILECNLDRQETKAALTGIRIHLDQAHSYPLHGAEELRWLVANGVTPLDILSTLAGFYIWGYSRPFPTDRAQVFALSRAVIALAPRPRKAIHHGRTSGNTTSVPPRVSALAYIGPKLMGASLKAVALVAEAVQLQHERREAQRLKPFDLPNSNDNRK